MRYERVEDIPGYLKPWLVWPISYTIEALWAGVLLLSNWLFPASFPIWLWCLIWLAGLIPLLGIMNFLLDRHNDRIFRADQARLDAEWQAEQQELNRQHQARMREIMER